MVPVFAELFDTRSRDCYSSLIMGTVEQSTGVVERWEALQSNAEDLQRVRALQRKMAGLRDELLDLAARVTCMESDLSQKTELESRIGRLKSELASLQDRRTAVLHVNVAVHRFLTDSGHPAAVLKDDVAELYRVWDETFQSVSQQLANLQRISETWQQFELHLTELKVALRSDQNTLSLLDSALQGGAVSPDVASSIRDVAKVLSDKHELDHDVMFEHAVVLNDSTTQTNPGTLVCPPPHTEGSLSDSGISDSGSEQELSERERRLAALRRLARHLEAILAPGSAALVNMAKRIEETEEELRGLQRTCRDLVVRTAVCVESRTPLPARKQTPKTPPRAPGLHRLTSRRKKSQSRSRDAAGPEVSCGNPGDDPDKGPSWLWRVMRAALPFHMAIVALFCVACLLEPNCCESINQLNFSLSPQLRYVRGPPPV